MRHGRWLDHGPPWLALGTVYSADLFSNAELALMALPLAAALLVETLRWDLGRWRRLLEVGALLAFLALVLARVGLLPTVAITLFLLCGIRLALPRELAQRRQLLLMGFLLFLTTCVAGTEPAFLGWALAWTALGALILLEQSWEGSALLRRGPSPPAPARKTLPWTFAATLIAVPFFLVMPRLTSGSHFLRLGLGTLAGVRAGFSDVLDLGLPGGPIGSNGEVVLRITPQDAEGKYRAEAQRDFALLRGIALESIDGQRWGVNPKDAPVLSLGPAGSGTRSAEIFLYPSPTNLIPVPYAPFVFDGRPPAPVEPRTGGGLAWAVAVRRGLPLRIRYRPLGPEGPGLADDPPRGPRLSALLHTEPGHEAAHRWSLGVAPENLPATPLANRLVAAFRSFGYSLDNPSGGASNPLQDFLERSRAGHCEYFASALALALRSRGVPARVVNGYRLGPFNEAGGYFLVTQNEAHSWVEYWEPERQQWRVADPTPTAPASSYSGEGAFARLRRWADALQYHWDRHVVRFSDEDQVAGMAFLAARLERMHTGLPFRMSARLLAGAAAGLIIAVLLGRAAWNWHRRRRSSFRNPRAIRALKPLLRRTRKLAPPRDGETLRAWMARLGALRPERAEALGALARLLESAHYGSAPERDLRSRVVEEGRHWR